MDAGFQLSLRAFEVVYEMISAKIISSSPSTSINITDEDTSLGEFEAEMSAILTLVGKDHLSSNEVYGLSYYLHELLETTLEIGLRSLLRDKPTKSFPLPGSADGNSVNELITILDGLKLASSRKKNYAKSKLNTNGLVPQKQERIRPQICEFEPPRRYKRGGFRGIQSRKFTTRRSRSHCSNSSSSESDSI
ncbi:unnamed protein product [Protopolystoma xenopodis]|uniref:Uncharacterized protein n=1 Tax=Protopolystoma xenopodis TaxID=117903 RepID=A0A448XDI2_9PLAT|nr:unnamed protein product [Protopolystoma xenopodis]